MAAARRTPSQQRELNELLTRDHTLNGAILFGLDGHVVEMQARAMEVLREKHSLTGVTKISGMAREGVRESLDRIAGAFAKLQLAESEVTVMVNLAPPDLPKDGAWLDLPLAILMLQAAGTLPDLAEYKEGDYILFGEVGLHGEIRRVPGALSLASCAKPGQTLIVPAGNEKECALIAERVVRGFFHSCATEDAEKVLSKVLSLGVLAELKGDTSSQDYVKYTHGGLADPEWEKSLRTDWPGKKEAIERLVREWNRYPLADIRDDGEAASGSRIRHFCSLSFAGAPEDSYRVAVEQEPSDPESFFFGSLPPWWKSEEPRSAAAPARKNPESRPDQSNDPAPASEKAVLEFRLRFKLASEMADDLRSILLGRPGHAAKPSDDNQEITVVAPPDVMNRVHTFITVMDWPDRIGRQPDYNYPRDNVLRAARSFFYACAIEDAPEVFSKLLSPGVLAQLKGETKSAEYLDYSLGGTPDPEWEKSLRVDWPGKKEAIERFVREWNRYPLKRITQESGVAIGFGVKHSCSVSFEGAPKVFYSVTIEPDRAARGTNDASFLFSSLPPWWKADEEDGASASRATKDNPPGAKPAGDEVLAAEVTAQSSSRESASPNGEIVGHLVDDVTGRPIQGAMIVCGAYINDWRETVQLNAVTDAKGQYRLIIPSPGIYSVWLENMKATRT